MLYAVVVRIPLVILVLLLALWGAATLARVSVLEISMGSGLFGVSLEAGAVWIAWSEVPAEWNGDRVEWASRRPVWLPLLGSLVGLEGWSLALPIWLLMLPVAAWLGVAHRRRRRRETVFCPCGYDARGLEVCPECGRTVVPGAD